MLHTYHCKCCDRDFDSETTIEEASEESVMMFGVKHTDPDASVVCEPCWLAMLEDEKVSA